MSLMLAIFLKPFIALAILVPIRVTTEVLRARMRDGKLKRILFSPLPGQRSRRG
jgi:hypothetical protein